MPIEGSGATGERGTGRGGSICMIQVRFGKSVREQQKAGVL